MTYVKKTQELKWNEGKVAGFKGRDLINLDHGSLKMVKVDPFANYPTHLHPKKTEYIYILEGSPEVGIGTEVIHGSPGDFITLPKNMEHYIKNPGAHEALILVGSIATP